MSTTNSDHKPRSNVYAKACQKTTTGSSFSTATYHQHRYQKPLLQRSYKTSQLAYNKGISMHKVLNNNSPNYLAQLFISHQSHYTNSRNNLYVPRPRLYLFKTSISFAGASLWNSLPQNIKCCISLPCFKRNLHTYMSENNLSSNFDGFV